MPWCRPGSRGILQYSEDIKKNETLAVMTLKGELVAAGKSIATSHEIERAEKGIMVDIKKVFMEPGTYPMMWK
ncbi:hypothetical protein GCM10025861_22510 [Methanobacterium petrolearium]|nr:hypothetical protein GCM10025861_22510 [Methanobacterium petrolearium]